MRATAGALLHIAVSILLVALLTSGLFMMAIASFDLASDDDVLSGIRQSTKYFRYELNAASEPVPPEKLLELATPLATKAFLERSTDTVFLLVVGPPDLAPVRAVLRESGYSPRTIRMGYHFPTILEELTSGHILALLLLAQLASLSLVGLWRCKRTKLTWFRGNPRRALAVGAAVGLCAATVAAALAQLAKVFGIALNEQSWVQPAVESAPVTTAIFVFLVVVLGPLAEEIFFRGYLFQFLRQRAPQIVAYSVSAVIFAAAHLNPSAFLVYLLLGVAFAYSLQKTGALAAAVVAHAVNNLLAVLLIVLW